MCLVLMTMTFAAGGGARHAPFLVRSKAKRGGLARVLHDSRR
jgi:hypothetical protein